MAEFLGSVRPFEWALWITNFAVIIQSISILVTLKRRG